MAKKKTSAQRARWLRRRQVREALHADRALQTQRDAQLALLHKALGVPAGVDLTKVQLSVTGTVTNPTPPEGGEK